MLHTFLFFKFLPEHSASSLHSPSSFKQKKGRSFWRFFFKNFQLLLNSPLQHRLGFIRKSWVISQFSSSTSSLHLFSSFKQHRLSIYLHLLRREISKSLGFIQISLDCSKLIRVQRYVKPSLMFNQITNQVQRSEELDISCSVFFWIP